MNVKGMVLRTIRKKRAAYPVEKPREGESLVLGKRYKT
jgi:hypothetical protein